MKAINIIGIILSVAILPVCVYYLEETSHARRASWDFFNEYSNYTGPSAAQVSLEAGLICALFGGYFIYQIIMNLVKVKTMTSKVMSIIAISLIGLAFLINLIFIVSDGGATYDEGGQIWVIAGIIMLAFSIVFLVQSVMFAKKDSKTQNAEIIDDII